jgi:hypothetical protein
MRNTLIPGAALALLLTTAACDPASIGMAAAGLAIDAITGSSDAAAQAPSIAQALGGIDDTVSDSCLAKIDHLKGVETAEDKDVEIATRSGNAAAGADQSVEPQEAADVETDQPQPVADDLPEMRTTTTSTTLSSAETENSCRLQPVCLPGNSFPVEMMMCEEGPTVVADGATAPDPAIDTTPKETTWAWSADDENADESAAP